MTTCTPTHKTETQPVARAETTRGGRMYTPLVDILERDDELTLIADVPGVTRDDVDITYERGLLTIHGRVDRPAAPENANRVMHEYGVGDWRRAFEIGEGIDSARIEAELADGVLTVHLPKSAEIQPRKIAIRKS